MQKQKLPVKAAHACVVIELNGRLFFLCPEREDGKGKELASGGSIEDCDQGNPLAAAQRELREEYGSAERLPVLGQTIVQIPGRPYAIALFVFMATPSFYHFINEGFTPNDEVAGVEWRRWKNWDGVRAVQVNNFALQIDLIIAGGDHMTRFEESEPFAEYADRKVEVTVAKSQGGDETFTLTGLVSSVFGPTLTLVDVRDASGAPLPDRTIYPASRDFRQMVPVLN